jgi:hypothetical protein
MRSIMKGLMVLCVLVTAAPVFGAVDGTQLLKQIDRNLNPEPGRPTWPPSFTSFSITRISISSSLPAEAGPPGKERTFQFFHRFRGLPT